MNIAAKTHERKATKITAPDAYGVLTEPTTSAASGWRQAKWK